MKQSNLWWINIWSSRRLLNFQLCFEKTEVVWSVLYKSLIFSLLKNGTSGWRVIWKMNIFEPLKYHIVVFFQYSKYTVQNYKEPTSVQWYWQWCRKRRQIKNTFLSIENSNWMPFITSIIDNLAVFKNFKCWWETISLQTLILKSVC